MFTATRKEYLYIALIVVITGIIGLAVRFSQPEIEISYPVQETILTAEDFAFQTEDGKIIVGVSSWDEVTALFPKGNNLGLSTIYRPLGDYCLFQFTEEENILDHMNIYTDFFITSRSIRVGDSLEAVQKQYGSDYATVKSKARPDYVELIYGGENNIVFQINNDKVAKIILQHNIYS